MNKKYQKIWELALPYQDARDDAGHGQIVTEFSEKLSEIEQAVADIAVPAAILHDIGWSQLDRNERFLIFDKRNTAEARLQARYHHQEQSVRLAREILEQVDYPQQFIDPILDIISEHDTRNGYRTKEEAVMRDADKLWRVSKIGFYDDIRQSNDTPENYHHQLASKIRDPNFLFLESSRKIAEEELSARHREFSA